MKIEHLKELLRNSGDIINEKQFYVVGSQSVLGRFPHAPEDLLYSVEADLIPKNQKKDIGLLESIGEGSIYHENKGFYADLVDENTAILPIGWKARLVNVNAPGVTGLCLDPNDLFISKVAAGRDKDMDFVRSMIENRMVDKDKVLQYARKVVNPEHDLNRSARIIEKTTFLFASKPVDYTKQVNTEAGRYTGEIIAVSGISVHQEVGRGNIVYHDIKLLNKVPPLNSKCTVQYHEGRGKIVEPPSQTKDIGR
jgi:hypothetical protein